MFCHPALKHRLLGFVQDYKAKRKHVLQDLRMQFIFKAADIEIKSKLLVIDLELAGKIG